MLRTQKPNLLWTNALERPAPGINTKNCFGCFIHNLPNGLGRN